VNKFVLDANVFIEAHKRYYPLDFCPGFWRALILKHNDKCVFSIDRVKKEIDEGNDELTTWANDRAPETFFKKTADKAVIDSFQKIVRWVHAEPHYTPEAKAEFANEADGWLVAYGEVNGCVAVTEEVHDPGVKKKVPIPNLCVQFKVEYMNTFDMLRDLGIKLVLGTQGK
jgi:hypothetical protein